MAVGRRLGLVVAIALLALATSCSGGVHDVAILQAEVHDSGRSLSLGIATCNASDIEVELVENETAVNVVVSAVGGTGGDDCMDRTAVELLMPLGERVLVDDVTGMEVTVFDPAAPDPVLVSSWTYELQVDVVDEEAVHEQPNVPVVESTESGFVVRWEPLCGWAQDVDVSIVADRSGIDVRIEYPVGGDCPAVPMQSVVTFETTDPIASERVDVTLVPAEVAEG
ncbi:MAG: hypothetical protein RIE08_16920 [Acidimicrobiales bacterium]